MTKKRPPKLPPDDPAADEEAARLFREAVESMGAPPRKKEDSGRGDSRGKGARAQPRERDGKVVKIDLHRMTVAEARNKVDGVLRSLLHDLRGQVKVMIITGKGRHSETAGVLAKAIHEHVRTQYRAHIVRLEDNPADLVVGELPIRGHFHVTLRK